MQRSDLSKFELPDCPGVYLFKQGRRVLYVGKATSLRDRVRSYFDDDLIAARGPRLVDVVTRSDRVAFEPTPTVLEALVREAALIRKHHPKGNAEGKDDKTFLYAVVTKEEIPRVLAVRGSHIDFKNKKMLEPRAYRLKAIFGPFPSGYQLREGLRLIRRIFPFFDTPRPVGDKNKHQLARETFYKQIGYYPKEFDPREYRKTIRKVCLFLAGRTKELRTYLQKQMRECAKEERFEEAAEARRELFALDHIQDVSLLKSEASSDLRTPDSGLRIEAYDTAHISGTNAIGVMTVVQGGAPIKKEYRTFNIRGSEFKDVRRPNVGRRTSKHGREVKKLNNDLASLKELLNRRLGHPEWQYPRAIVVDGGRTHKKAAEAVLAEHGIKIPVAAVVKDEKHRPREVIGARQAGITDADAVLANAEAHRFSLSRHRRARSQVWRR